MISLCYIIFPDQYRQKLNLTSEEHIFWGIAQIAKAWKYYNKYRRTVRISRNIIFYQKDTRLYVIPGEEDEEEAPYPTKRPQL